MSCARLLHKQNEILFPAAIDTRLFAQTRLEESMTQRKVGRSPLVQLWLLALVVSVIGFSLVLGLGTLAPVFLEESAAGMAARLFVVAICFDMFVAVHRGRLRGRPAGSH